MNNPSDKPTEDDLNKFIDGGSGQTIKSKFSSFLCNS